MTAHIPSRRGAISLMLHFLLTFLFTISAMAQVTTNLLNINFGGGSKVGLSGTGLTTNDTWNVISGSANFTTNNLLWANATTSSVSLTFTNLPSNSSPIYGLDDGMLSTYVTGTAYDFGESVAVPAIITISNLPPSTYKVYAYGSGAGPDWEYESFTLSVGTNGYGTKTTANYWFDPTTEPLTEGVQYVVFTNVVVTNGQVLTLDLAGTFTHTVNGLQIIDDSPLPNLPAVTFDPASGAEVPVSVSLSVADHMDATIYYTTDGSTPTTGSSVYSTALSLTVATTVKAIATKTGYQQAPLSTASYLLPLAPTPSISPSAGTYTNLVEVSVSSGLGGSSVWFATNASSWMAYTGSFVIGTNTTVRSYVTKTGYRDSGIATNIYVINLPTAPTPSMSPAGGEHHSEVEVTISSSLGGATLQVSTNGSSWQTITSTTNLDASTPLLARVIKTGYLPSATVSNYFTFTPATTVFTPNGGTFTNAQSITLSNSTPGVTLEYTTNFGTNWITYTNSFSLDGIGSGTGWIFVRASKSGYSTTTIPSSLFTFVMPAPTFTPPGGYYTNDVDVVLSSPVTNAVISYLVDTAWDWEDYGTNAIHVGTNTVIKAYATRSGYLTSGNASFEASAGFSGYQGLNNWSYLYSTEVQGSPDTYLPYYSSTLGAWMMAENQASLVGSLHQRPAATNDSVRAFQLPYDGTVIITGTAQLALEENYGDGVQIRVLLGTNVLSDWQAVYPYGSPVTIQLTNAVTNGQVLYFQVTAGETDTDDLVSWNPVVTYSYQEAYLIADADGDGLSDGLEWLLGTNPNNPDTDGDGVSDLVERLLGRNPFVAGSTTDSSGLLNLKVFTPLRQ